MKNSLFSFLFFLNAAFSQSSNFNTLINDITSFKQLEILLPFLNTSNGIPSIFPLKNTNIFHITSKFGSRFHPIEKSNKFHSGIDIAAEVGTLVIATANGKVDKISFSQYGYGRSIIISHEYGYKTQYSHLSIVIPTTGSIIKKGDVIGMVGTTGKSTGNHLHYEVIKNNTKLDPADFFFIDYNSKINHE